MTPNIPYFILSVNNNNVSCTVHKLVIRYCLTLTIKGNRSIDTLNKIDTDKPQTQIVTSMHPIVTQPINNRMVFKTG